MAAELVPHRRQHLVGELDALPRELKRSYRAALSTWRRHRLPPRPPGWSSGPRPSRRRGSRSLPAAGSSTARGRSGPAARSRSRCRGARARRSRAGSCRTGRPPVRASASSRRRWRTFCWPTLACRRMLNPSAYAAMMPYSMPLWIILTKWPAPCGPQCSKPCSTLRDLAAAPRRAARRVHARRQCHEDRAPGVARSAARRRSSGSSRVRARPRRRWCRHRDSGCRARPVFLRAGCRRGSRNCRRR